MKDFFWFFGKVLMVVGAFMVLGSAQPSDEMPLWVSLVSATTGFAAIFGGHRLHIWGGGAPIFDSPWKQGK